MGRKSSILFERPQLFQSSFSRQLKNYAGFVIDKNFQDVSKSNIQSTSSFKYDPIGTGLKSTQQIPLDWSKFEEHTFFNSAEVKVNVAFDKIINTFPFDGTKKDLESFFDSLTGFEKYVYDKFPKNKGFLLFSGTQLSETQSTKGTYIKIQDFAGIKYPTLSKDQTANNVLDPELKSFSAEMQLFVPAQTNDCQTVFQKIGSKTTRTSNGGGSQGISLFLSESSSTSDCKLVFGAISGSMYLTASTMIQKGQFNHIYVEFNRNPNINRLGIFVNEKLMATSSNVGEFGLMNFRNEPLYIGSGSRHNNLGFTTSLRFIPRQTLSGAIDEFRIYHDVISIEQQKQFAKKSIFSTPELRLYYKFNEPTGTIGNNAIVLDSSGRSLHAEVSNYVHTLRNTGSITNPMTYEKTSLNPILFPIYSDTRNLNSDLLFSASLYDDANPNLITKLVPKHYFQEGQQYEGHSTEEGDIVDEYGGEGIPGTGELGNVQLLSSFLFVYSNFLDELKIVIDHFSNLLHVDYDQNGTVADQFLPFVAKYYGFEIPGLFVDSSIEQFIDAENLTHDVSTSALPLQSVQNQVWRRILVNLGEIIRSKGTLHSVRSLMRCIGIDPDSNFRIREFGGPTNKALSESRQKKTEVSTLLDFSGTVSSTNSSVNSIGEPLGKPFIKSTFLSGSRIEIGYPEARGTFVKIDQFPPHGISNNTSDGLFTSGSWTYEAVYKFPQLLSGNYTVTQSLCRLNTTGSTSPATKGALLLNLIAISGSLSGSLKLLSRPGNNTTTSAPLLEMELTGVNIFDGNKWNVSFGCTRNDNSVISSIVSSSYFLRAARSHYGDIVESTITSSYFIEDVFSTANNNMFRNISSLFNTSGPYICIGSQSIETVTNRFLNDVSTVPNLEARITDFEGKIGHMRFWSKDLSLEEWKEHARNFKSLGVSDPLINFNFRTQESGSFERLRMDVSTDQIVTQSNSSGQATLDDFSQNNILFAATGFEPSKSIIKPEIFNFSFISPKFDEYMNDNKVRIRSFSEQKNIDEYGGQIAPVYEIDKNELPMDDTRFSIDFSVVDALNEDMVSIFAVLDKLDNIIGDPELVFSQDYPGLANIRKIYFNRLTEKINLKNFFTFFKWFDGFIGMTNLIEKLIPRKTKFLGMNFVIESHMLERHKLEYKFYDQYIKKRILIQAPDFSAKMKKF